MTDVDVVILSCARTPALRELTEQALATLSASADPATIRFRPVVVESAAEVTCPYPGTRTLFPKTQFGYHRYMNLGIAAGSAPFVCMCNNDLVFHPGWADTILRAFSTDPELMSASPYCGYFHGRVLPNPDAELIPGYENGVHVTGWCLFVRRSLFDVIGALDERFAFWFCDDDFRLTLRSLGLKHSLVTQARVDHLGSRTLAAETDRAKQERLTSRQAVFFHYKWGHRSRVLYWLRLLKFSLRSALARK